MRVEALERIRRETGAVESRRLGMSLKYLADPGFESATFLLHPVI